MLQRIIYTLKQTISYRRQLGQIARQQAGIITTQIAGEMLQNYQALILDFDGVLAAHGEIQARADVEMWLDKCFESLGDKPIFILSNKPMPKRIAYFKKRFPSIQFVTGVAKKPYPDGLKHIAKQQGFKPKELVLVDDRLLTGVLASCIAGTEVIYISPAYSNFKKHPLQESFFASLRLLERQILRWF